MLKIFRLIPLLKRVMPLMETIGSTKSWWKSETIWVNIGAVLMSAGALFGFDMAGVDVAGIVGPVFGVVMALFNIAQRFATRTAIGE